ncbi:YciI-like protein [Streptomyces sp. T-3]|nr:YciI-like protein [Streptomyces sp. T-3]
MAHYVLEYAYTEDYLERRGAYRDEHLAMVRKAHERGELPMAGVVAEPVDRALLVWQVEDPGVVERFVEQDPYVRHGLVTRWTVRPWNLVVGG